MKKFNLVDTEGEVINVVETNDGQQLYTLPK